MCSMKRPNDIAILDNSGFHYGTARYRDYGERGVGWEFIPNGLGRQRSRKTRRIRGVLQVLRPRAVAAREARHGADVAAASPEGAAPMMCDPFAWFGIGVVTAYVVLAIAKVTAHWLMSIVR